MLTWLAASGVDPSRTVSYWLSTDAVTVDRSAVANSFRPSVRRISAVNGLNWLAEVEEFLMTSTGPPGPWSGGGGGGAAVVNDQLTGAMTLPAASLAPLTAAVYEAEVASREVGVNVAVVVAGS
jgi:hypothetical protein